MSLFGLFGKNKSTPEDSLPRTDAEQWIVSTYALWSEYCGGSWKFIGGYEKNRSNASMARGVLNRDWLVTNSGSGREMVTELVEKTKEGDAKAAFDYACACNLCGRMYLGGYMTREESMELAKTAAGKLQKQYHSWKEFCQAYIEGTKLESGIADQTAVFEEACRRLSAMDDGPYRVAWDQPL